MEEPVIRPACPTCGSHALQYLEGSNLNVGRAVAGFAIAGPLGALAGGITGERRLNIICQSCGLVFNHYLTRRCLCVAKNYLGIDVDFAEPAHRAFYGVASGDLRRIGRANVTQPRLLYDQWKLIRKHADTVGLFYCNDNLPAGLSAKVVEKIEVPSGSMHSADAGPLLLLVSIAALIIFVLFVLVLPGHLTMLQWWIFVLLVFSAVWLLGYFKG